MQVLQLHGIEGLWKGENYVFFKIEFLFFSALFCQPFLPQISVLSKRFFSP